MVVTEDTETSWKSKINVLPNGITMTGGGLIHSVISHLL